MDNITVGDQSYPLNFGFSTLRRLQRDAGVKKLHELAEAAENLEFLPVIIQSGIESGLRLTHDNRALPSLDDIELELDRSADLLANTYTAFGAALSGGGEKPDEGN